jgi:dTDP-4-amino-4,6-dideoxygalactose transaminase
MGTSGNYCAFSFQAIKHLTTGDGGLLVLPNEKELERARLLRWYGIDRNYRGKTDFRVEQDIEEHGYKFHMNDINATIGLSNLKHIDSILEKHISNAMFYHKNLSNVSGLILPKKEPEVQSSYWLFTLKVEDRNNFMLRMQEKGIVTSRVHDRNDRHPCVKEFKTELPQLDDLIDQIVCIPVGWWVTEEEREYIVSSIKEGW